MRRECVDHVIVLNERSLHRILRSYIDYYHLWRTHLSLGKDAPVSRRVERLCCNFRAATSGWTTFGKHRTGSPIMPSDNPFKWRQFEPALILQCVRWYLRYALS